MFFLSKNSHRRMSFALAETQCLNETIKLLFKLTTMCEHPKETYQTVYNYPMKCTSLVLRDESEKEGKKCIGSRIARVPTKLMGK